jgi:dTDP-glucose 4,6-dehydratase
VSIYDLARLVAGGAPAPLAVERGREPAPGVAPERYVPATARARAELGLRERVGLADAIERTVRWHASSGAPGRAVAA